MAGAVWCTGQCCPLWRPYPSTIISVEGHVAILLGNKAIVRTRISGLWGGQRMIGVGTIFILADYLVAWDNEENLIGTESLRQLF
ncbi:unnamed protein product, partial [Mesorhabditis belari]|uniref:Uncharacterized protein n=1 Tax=Mesorhabditis belari TaxID=2138241 RepID=A0AAF3ER76_9BILA